MKRAVRKMCSKRNGSAIVLAMFAVLILFLTGAGLLRLGLNSRVYAVRTAEQIKARCAADAGMAQALFQMNEQLQVKPWDDSTLPSLVDELLESGDSSFSYTVTGNEVSGYLILSTGNSGVARRAVHAYLRLFGPFEYAIFADDWISIYNSATVDWYNYEDDDPPLQVGTNNIEDDKVVIKNNGTINGDVLVGPDANPDEVIDNGGTITGNTGSLPVTNELQSVTVPTWLQSLPSGGILEDTTTLTTSGKFSEIDLKTSNIITIDGAVTLYVTGDLTLNNDAIIEIVNTNPDACLTLYLGGNFEGKNGSTLNNLTADASKLKIFALDSCQQMIFKNSTDLYGAIYAPKADVTFDNSADAYGAVVAQTFEQKNSATFYYDASLRETDINDDLVRFAIGHWSED